MVLRWVLFSFVLSLCGSFIQAGPYDWILYSKDETNVQCLLYDHRYFCHSTFDKFLLQQTNISCTNGILWSFSKLKQNNITTDELINWFIPFDIIEQYASYLNSSSFISNGNTTICNCTENRIGAECEYKLISDSSNIGQIIVNQMRDYGARDEEIASSLNDDIECDASGLTLEWRQVCDGIIHCQNGADELNCHLLEFNKCNQDEYQCRNGMCIPKEFVFDAFPDCMDSSDEQEIDDIYERYNRCPKKSAIECDERLCRKDQFSCGDGQCVSWSSVINHLDRCANLRDAAYLCETVDFLVNTGLVFNGICLQTRSPLPQLTNTSSCVFSLRHMLLASQSKQPNIIREISLNNIIDRCPELIQYPEQPVLSPILKMFYNKSWIVKFYEQRQNFHHQMSRRPYLVCLSGSMMCNGILMTLRQDDCMLHNVFKTLVSFPFYPIPHLFCQVAAKQAAFESTTTLLPSSSFFTCPNSLSDHLAFRRVNDGYHDCLYGEDEKNNDHKINEPYRYRCQTVSLPVQYVSFQQLGNGKRECADGSDELSYELHWPFFKCNYNDTYACWVFQDDGIINNRIKDVRLLFHRYCDTVWDTIDGRDEQNCSHWVCGHDMYQCNKTGQCIHEARFCDGEFDCDDGEDELSCPTRPRQWHLEFECNKTHEHFCITSQYLQNRTLNRPCIPYSQAGDGQIDCIGGRDERNVFSCSDHLMLGDRFLCDNQTKCLNYTVLCDGIDDCLDRTDELICFWDRTKCAVGQFSCSDGRGCKKHRCDPKELCSNRANWFWCPNSTTAATRYRPTKHRRLSNYETFCYSHSTVQHMSPITDASSTLVSGRKAGNSRPYGFCNRGFYLTIHNDTKRICFCPPSFYGDRCHYDSRRITVRVRFDRRHRSDLPSVIYVLVSLVFNDTLIIDHQTFVDIHQDLPLKHNVYLLYSRPRFKGKYSVRLEAYHSTSLLAIWECAISPLDFLPAFRLAKVLRFPDRVLPWLCSYNQCQNNGTCYNVNNDEHLCLCQRGWQGVFCEKKTDHIKCSPYSLARDRNVCICPYGYLQPHCFVRNTICEKPHSCSINEMCHPLSIQPLNRYRCVCNSSSCDIQKSVIVMHRQEPNKEPFLLQLLKFSSDYPRVRQQILVGVSTKFPITRVIDTRDGRHPQGAVPEIGLLFTFEPQIRSVSIVLNLLYVNCTNFLRNYTVDLDTQPQRCRSLNAVESRSVKLFHTFCQQPVKHSCFFTVSYVCYCSSRTSNRTECMSYLQRNTACTFCLNQGYCIQGDLQNKSNFVCVCPKCASGVLCQFSPSRFSISLELLIEKTNWNGLHFIGPIIFFIVGGLFNSLCVVTFTEPKARKTGTGLYLLLNTIISQIVLALLLLRVLYLYIARRINIQQQLSTGLCKSLPYLMTSLDYVSLWLMVLVTVERALAVTVPTRFYSLRTPKSASIITAVMSVFLFGSVYIYIGQYKLVSHPDDLYPWCIREIQPSQEGLIQYTSLAHQITLFFVNLVAGFIIILVISRSKAASHHLAQSSVLAKQTRERLDLLLGPIVCFITQLPQLIILFLDACHYEHTSWFVHLTLITYYISFMPQISLLFIYLLPSPLYKEILFTKTVMGQRLAEMMRRS